MKTIALSALALVVATGFAMPAFADASNAEPSSESATESFDWAAFQNRQVVGAKGNRVLTQIDVRQGSQVVVIDGETYALNRVKAN